MESAEIFPSLFLEDCALLLPVMTPGLVNPTGVSGSGGLLGPRREIPESAQQGFPQPEANEVWGTPNSITKNLASPALGASAQPPMVVRPVSGGRQKYRSFTPDYWAWETPQVPFISLG